MTMWEDAAAFTAQAATDPSAIGFLNCEWPIPIFQILKIVLADRLKSSWGQKVCQETSGGV